MTEKLSVKKCTKCGEEKSSSEFSADSRQSSGLQAHCKECKNADARARRAANPDKERAYRKARYDANPDVFRERSKKWYIENTEKSRNNAIEWRNENRDWVNEYGRDYSRKWREENRERARHNSREHQKKRRENPKHKLEDSIKNGILRGIKRGSKNGRSTFKILGYSREILMDHLEKLFLPGMSWENYGEWHIDHKVPLSAFNFNTPDDIDFKKAWTLNNLQPLWAFENRSKNDRLDAPFQPSLALAIPTNENKQEQA